MILSVVCLQSISDSVSQGLATHACHRLSAVSASGGPSSGRPVLLHTRSACLLQIVTGLEQFLHLVNPSAASSQVPTAVASSEDPCRDGGQGPLFQQRCAWPGQSQVAELGSLEGLLQAAFRGQRGTQNGEAPARSGCTP